MSEREAIANLVRVAEQQAVNLARLIEVVREELARERELKGLHVVGIGQGAAAVG
jgi:hypothetical protein